MAKEIKKTTYFRDFDVVVELDFQSGDSIYLSIKDSYDCDNPLTDKQKISMAQQISDKIGKMKFQFKKAISCPNCGDKIDQDEKIDTKFHCNSCNLDVKMEFGKK